MPQDDAPESFINSASAPSDRRALVVVEPAMQAKSRRRMLPCSSPFLAQLIATKLDMPTTRARRRASAAAAISVYRGVSERLRHA